MTRTASIDDMFGRVDARTFLGLPTCDDPGEMDADVAVLGAPVVTPYRSIGAYCAGAPAAIRRAIAPYAANLQHVDFDLGRPLFPDGEVRAVDLGDLEYGDDFSANREALRTRVAGVLARGAAPVVLGGDDSTPIPVLQAFADSGPITIVQIDAHIDWRDEVDGERQGLSSTMRRASEMAHVEHIVQVGQRGIGSARSEDLRAAQAYGVRFVSAREVARSGVMTAVTAVPEGADVVISLDVDGLDPTVVPGVVGRAPGGLGYWQTLELIHGVTERARLRGFCLVEFMPERDVDDLGALACARITANAIGLLAGAAASRRA